MSEPLLPQSAPEAILPPHAPASEQGVLGCMIAGGADTIAEAASILSAGGEEFYDLRHRSLWLVLCDLYEHKRTVDMVVLAQTLKDKGITEDCGGIAYVSALPDVIPSPAHIKAYLEVLVEKHQRRKLLRVCHTGIAGAIDEGSAIDGIIDGFEAASMGIRSLGGIEETDPRKDLDSCIALLEAAHENKGRLRGLGTGFMDLDRMTHGLMGSSMVVVAARPSVGKSSLLMNIAEHVAIKEKTPVGIFSLEMDSASLRLRSMCSIARVDCDAALEGRMDQGQFKRMASATVTLKHAPMSIIDRGGLSINQIRGYARKLKQRHGIKLLLIDYLQLISATVGRSDGRTVEVTKVSGGIKAMAKELGIPVIVAAQLNREMEKGTGREPRLSDLRESGALEQDADIVILLHRKAELSPGVQTIRVNVAKQRNGRTGFFDLTFFAGQTRFESATAVNPEDGRW